MNRVIISMESIKKHRVDIMWRRGDNVGGSARADESGITITSANFVGLHNGDYVRITRRTQNGVMYEFSGVIDNVYSENTFHLTVPERKSLAITEITHDDATGFYMITFDSEHYILPYDLDEDSEFMIVLYSSEGEQYEIGNLNPVYRNYFGTGATYEEDGLTGERLNGFALQTNDRTIAPLLETDEDGTPLYYGLNASFNKNPFFHVIDGDIVKLWEDVEIYKETDFISFPIEVEMCEETGLQHEELVTSKLVENVIGNSIPEVIDMEKVVFEPYDFIGNRYITAITIDYHFRKRWSSYPGYENYGWSIRETENWNNTAMNASDGVSALTFTYDDIYYQKEKVQKTFLRISYYNTKKIFNQQLLAYSTVFFDAGDMYGKLMSSTATGITEAARKENALKDVTCEINIYDKYNVDHSSEGFYLYMFPSEVGNSGEKTIYMKVEFNHGGLGKTVPLPMRKNNTNTNLTITVSQFHDYLYIPIKIKKDATTGKYLYGLTSNGGTVYCTNGHLHINLLETKLNE